MLWGGTVFAFLAPALALPSFLLLFLGSTRILAGFLWFLTVASSICFYIAVRIDGNYANPSTPSLFLGVLWNPFTQYMICLSALVQLAAICYVKGTRKIEPTTE
jgi:hypothetical protein